MRNFNLKLQLTLFFVLIAALVILAMAGIAKFNKEVKMSKVYNTTIESMLPVSSLPEKKAALSTVALSKEVKRIIIEDDNTVAIQGTVTEQSMALLISELAAKANKLSPSDPIFIVVDTGGGSIFAGIDFIEYAKSLPNPIFTITKFAASMGFEIVQQLGTRYILEMGVFMSHRAAGSVEGQFDGELESRLEFYKDMFSRLDATSAARMGITLAQYKELILNEFWSTGFRAITNKTADEIVRVSCGNTLLGVKTAKVPTLFGSVKVVISKCPLIRGVINSEVTGNANPLGDFTRAVEMSYNSPKEYLDTYIKTNKFKEIFGK